MGLLNFNFSSSQNINDFLCSIELPLFISFILSHITSRQVLKKKKEAKMFLGLLFANLQTTLLLEVFSRDAGNCDPSRLVLALIKSLGLEGVLGLWLGGGITEPETFLWPRFSLLTLSSSSFPMVFDLTRGNLDRIDNRWKPSLYRYYFWDD